GCSLGGLHILDGLAGGGVGGDAEDAESVVEVMLGLHLLCAGGDLPRDLLDLASREVRGVLGDALLKSSGGHGLPPRLPPSAYQRAVVPCPPVPVFGPFVRGDETKIGRRGWWRQAGGAKNFDRYRCVTLWRQEKTPRPARMQIRGCWVTSTQQRRYGGGSRQTAPHSAWPSRWTPTPQRVPRRRYLRSRRCPA